MPVSLSISEHWERKVIGEVEWVWPFSFGVWNPISDGRPVLCPKGSNRLLCLESHTVHARKLSTSLSVSLSLQTVQLIDSY